MNKKNKSSLLLLTLTPFSKGFVGAVCEDRKTTENVVFHYVVFVKRTD